MLLGVPIADILHLRAKQRGGWDDAGGRKDTVCTYIWPSFVSPGMQEFLDSEEWHNKSHWDRVFYNAVNRSLDLTIDRLGRKDFEEKLALYKRAKELSNDKCLQRTTFPCSAGGIYTPHEQTDCMWGDSACGVECLDEVATELNLWR